MRCTPVVESSEKSNATSSAAGEELEYDKLGGVWRDCFAIMLSGIGVGCDGSSGMSAKSVGVKDRCCGEGLFPVE